MLTLPGQLLPFRAKKRYLSPPGKSSTFPCMTSADLARMQSCLSLMNAKLYLNGFFNLAHIFLRKNVGAVKKP